MVQKAKRNKTSTDKLRESLSNNELLFNLNRFTNTPATIGNALFSNNGGSAGGSTGPAGNYLKTAGDTMVGPIAYYPATVSINASDEIDIAPGTTSAPKGSSYIIVSFSTPDTLQLIEGASFAGQVLYLQVPASSTLTLEDYSSNATGNIVTSTGADIEITTTSDPKIIELKFDVTVSPNSNTGGWVVMTSNSMSSSTVTSTDITCPDVTAEYLDYANWSSQEPGSLELANNGVFTNSSTSARHNEIDDDQDAVIVWHYNGIRKAKHVRVKVEDALISVPTPVGTHDVFIEYYDGSTWASLPTVSSSEWTVSTTTPVTHDYDLDVDIKLSKIRVRVHHNDDGVALYDAKFFSCTIDELPNTCDIAYVNNNDLAIECHDVIPVSFEHSGFTTAPTSEGNANDGDFGTKTGTASMSAAGSTCNGTWNFGRLRKVSHIKMLVTDGRSSGTDRTLTGKWQYLNSSDTWVDINDWHVETVPGKEQLIDQDVDFTAKALRVIWTRDTGDGTFQAEFYGATYSYIIEDCNVLHKEEALITGALYTQAEAQIISSGEIDVSVDNDYVSRIVVTGEGSADDDLDTITVGDITIDRILTMQAAATTDITLKHGTGNIRTLDGNDLVLEAEQNVLLVYDSTSNEWAVVAAGAVSSGSAIDKISEGDSSVEVVDTGTGSIVFVADTVSQGTITDAIGWSIDNDVSINSSNTLTVGGTTTLNGDVQLGNATSDNITGSGQFQRDVIPDSDITYNLGSSSLYWASCFFSTLNVGSSAANYGTIRADSNGLEIRANVSGDSVEIQTAGANTRASFAAEADGGIIFFEPLEVNDEITIDGGNVIKAFDSVECGFQVTNESISIGSSGTLQIPHVSGSSSTAAAADTAFGDVEGCMGIYTNTTSNTHTLVVRQGDGNWAGVLLTDNTLV